MTMRTLIVAACVSAFLPSAAAAQVGGGIKGGVSFGRIPNIETELDEPGATAKALTGYAWGGFITIKLGNGFMIQPEALYTQKGAKVDIDAGGLTGTFKVKVDYLEIPILARLTFGKVVRGYVFGGPSMNFNLSAKTKVSALGISDEEDISSEIEDFEFALVFGGGVEFGPVLIEGRWSEGMTNIAKSTGLDVVPDLKTRTTLLLFGVRF